MSHIPASFYLTVAREAGAQVARIKHCISPRGHQALFLFAAFPSIQAVHPFLAALPIPWPSRVRQHGRFIFFWLY